MATEPEPRPTPTSAPSGEFYTTVSRHWPRIATGLVVVLGLLELVVGGLTADSGIELYLMAWAGTTGGVWFIFDKGEQALSDENRVRVAEWIESADVQGTLRTVPAGFALLFDRVFGERHWSTRCFSRSAWASLITGLLVFGVILAADDSLSGSDLDVVFIVSVLIFFLVAVENAMGERHLERAFSLLLAGIAGFSGAILGGSLTRGYPLIADPFWWSLILGQAVMAAFFMANFVPDFVSLLETRWAIRLMQGGRRLFVVLVLDVLATWMIWVLFVLAVAVTIPASWGVNEALAVPSRPMTLLYPPSLFEWLFSAERATEMGLWLRVSFFSTFLTSVWLWLYAVSVGVSRLLLRMNAGIGFLLRLTDVRSHPFRALGFVSVIVTSALFAAGLPFVLV